MLSCLAVANYRSLRQLAVPLGQLTVVTGPNGSGKSSLYRALRLLVDIAEGRIIRSLAREGGLASALWAGPERLSGAMRRGTVPVQGTVRRDAIHLRLGFAGSRMEDLGYAIDLGLPQLGGGAFVRDPEIKAEWIWFGPQPRPAALAVERKRELLRVGGAGGGWQAVPRAVPPRASMLTEYADPRGAPEMLTLRERLRSWRFYDHFRTDPDAPARQPQVGTFTPVLEADGADLAAALQTIREIGDADALDAAVADAFPGATLEILPLKDPPDGRLEVLLRQHGLLRLLSSAEWSDGTLRYLLWIAALLTPRPPELLVLNEPETSLHPDLLPPLGRLIAQAATLSQTIVVSHSAGLIQAIERAASRAGGPSYRPIVLAKDTAETFIANLTADERPDWRWPGR